MKSLYFPALRGKFGNWIFYSCLMPLRVLARRVSYASELQKNKGLSDMLQRVLDEERAKNIATYLVKQDDRFFNSIVIAVYGGDPKWFAAGRITARNTELELNKIDYLAQESIGFLKLRGDERLFTLDGQHRLAGIRRAVKDKPRLGRENAVSYLRWAQKND
jgi:DNA sulfur modification protein DndB